LPQALTLCKAVLSSSHTNMGAEHVDIPNLHVTPRYAFHAFEHAQLQWQLTLFVARRVELKLLLPALAALTEPLHLLFHLFQLLHRLIAVTLERIRPIQRDGDRPPSSLHQRKVLTCVADCECPLPTVVGLLLWGYVHAEAPHIIHRLKEGHLSSCSALCLAICHRLHLSECMGQTVRPCLVQARSAVAPRTRKPGPPYPAIRPNDQIVILVNPSEMGAACEYSGPHQWKASRKDLSILEVLRAGRPDSCSGVVELHCTSICACVNAVSARWRRLCAC
jgi:hypothetical protein